MGYEHNFKWVQIGIHRETPRDIVHKTNCNAKRLYPKANITSRGGKFVRKKSDISHIPPLRNRFLGNILSHSKEIRRMETNSKLETIKSVHKAKEISHGNFVDSHEERGQGSLGHVNRFKGRIFTCPNQSCSSQMAPFHDSRPGLCIQVPSLWPLDGTKGVYQNSNLSVYDSSQKGGENIHLLRRLDNPSTNSAAGGARHSGGAKINSKFRFHCQSKKVSSHTNNATDLSGSSLGSGSRSGNSIRRENSEHESVHKNVLLGTTAGSQSMAQDPGLYGKSSGFGAELQVAYEANSITPVVLLQTNDSSVRQKSTFVRHCSSRIKLVDRQAELNQRNSVSQTSSSSGPNDGCVINGLGRSYGVDSSARSLDYARKQRTYKLIGTVGSSSRTCDFGRTDLQQDNQSQIRQFHGGVLHKQTRRHEVSNPVFTYKNTDNVVSGSRDCSRSSPHPGDQQCFSGQFIQGCLDESYRMDDIDSSFSESTSHSHVPNDRLICNMEEQTTPGVLLSNQRRQGISSRCTVNNVDRNVCVRLPSNIHDSQDFGEDTQRGLYGSTDSSAVAQTVLVSQIDGLTSGPSDITSPEGSGSPENARNESSIPQHRKSPINSLDIIKQRYQKEGFSEETADLVARGRRDSTLKVYTARIRPFIVWCEQNKIDPYSASIADIAEFLRLRFETGVQSSTVRGYLTAIQSVHTGCHDGSVIKNNQTLKLLIEGMLIARPRVRNIWPSWDLPTVLDKLELAPFEPIQSASLRDTALKTIFLLALATGRRCSELHALAVGRFIVFGQNGATLYFRPGFLAKNERSDFSSAPLFLPFITKSNNRAKRLNCPVRALKWYIDKTKIVRGDIEQLFITNMKPYRPAAKSTLAGWLVNVINSTKALLELGKPKAHSVRAMSSSWAFNRGLSVKEIINTVAWKTSNTFIKVYLKDVGPRTGLERYARKVLTTNSQL
jgi:integrase